MRAAPRSRAQRRHDTEQQLAHDVDVWVATASADGMPREQGDRFAARAGFDPRALATSYRWFRIRPRRIQAWREVDELPDRDVMREGRWLV